MAIPFTCPHCGVQVNVDPSYAGQTGPCSKCGEKITIPPLKATELPPIGAYGDQGPQRSSAGCLVAVLAIAALSMLAVVCVGGAFFARGGAMQAAQSAQSNNNLKQIGLALLNYHDAHGAFPPAYVADAEGKKLYSWRVLILPFLEQAPLYDRFDKNKAWDSPENINISNALLPVFAAPGEGPSCSYFALTGKGTAFDGDKQCRLVDIRDGTSNTIGVVEVRGLSKSWAEPFDIDLDGNAQVMGTGVGQIPGPAAAGRPNNLFHCLRFDGSTISMVNLQEPVFRSMAMIADGSVVPAVTNGNVPLQTTPVDVPAVPPSVVPVEIPKAANSDPPPAPAAPPAPVPSAPTPSAPDSTSGL